METYTFASVSQQSVRKQNQRNKTLISNFLKGGYAATLPSPLPSLLIPSLWLLLIKLWAPNSYGSSPHSLLLLPPSALQSWCSALLHVIWNLSPTPDQMYSPQELSLSFPILAFATGLFLILLILHPSFCQLCLFLKESFPFHILPLTFIQKTQKPWGQKNKR